MNTATEIELKLSEARERIRNLENKALKPVTDKIFKILYEMTFAPKRKRWDQFGAYHRRQIKKWRKSLPQITRHP